MNEKRLAHLNQMLTADPEDPFLLYAIALEYMNGERLEEARTGFKSLMDRHPSYVATYYQYAIVLVKSGELEEAEKVLATGIELARKAGEMKTANELAMLLEDLED